MTAEMDTKLNDAKIQHLLAVVGSRPAPVRAEDSDAMDYNWRLPRYFSPVHMEALERFADGVARECLDGFTRLYRSPAEVSVVSVMQCFSRSLGEYTGPGDHSIAFGPDAAHPCGVIQIPAASARVWVGQSLGGGDAADEPERELSELEVSFLIDIAAGFAAALSRACGGTFQTDNAILADPSGMVLQGSEELLMITLQARRAGSDEVAAPATCFICCDKLKSVVANEEAEKKQPASDLAAAMRQHIGHVPVALTVELGRTKLPLKEVLGLQVNDVVILENNAAAPIEIKLKSKTLFRGRPAMSGGKQAVVIV